MNTQRSNKHRRAIPSTEILDEQMTPSCPLCGESATTYWHHHAFDYGTGDDAVEIQAHIPVRQCSPCEIEFLDYEAEQLEHEAICNHFGVLTPDEIRRIRESYGMTQAQFSEVTGIGTASLNRWENALNIQFHANDRYLRLLEIPDNMGMLQKLMEARKSEIHVPCTAADRFPNLLGIDDKRKHQEAYDLRLDWPLAA